MYSRVKSAFFALCTAILLSHVGLSLPALAQAPDEPTIAFATSRGGGSLWLVDPDGDNARAVPNAPGGVSWNRVVAGWPKDCLLR